MIPVAELSRPTLPDTAPVDDSVAATVPVAERSAGVNSAASDSGPELRLLGNQSARVFLERDGGRSSWSSMRRWCRRSLDAAVLDHKPEELRPS